MTDTLVKGTRAVAIVGPYQSGKTSLVESILCLTGALHRKGDGGARIFGDSSKESKDHGMGVELNVASTEFMGDKFTFLDCPGSIEMMQETLNVLQGVDAAIIVVEPDAAKLAALAPIMRKIEDDGIPHFIFVNKIDKATGLVRDLKRALQKICSQPVVLRQIPIREGDDIRGYVDLAAARAYVYTRQGPSERIDQPTDDDGRIAEARYKMLETLADYDEHLMEELLEDIDPPNDEVFKDLAEDLQNGHIVPVMLGSAVTDSGVFRLMKALRHEMKGVADTCERLGIEPGVGLSGQVLKTYHTAHGGKMSVARIFAGTLKEGETISGHRIGGLVSLMGLETKRLTEARAGDVVAITRTEALRTGDVIGRGDLAAAPTLPPVYSLALTIANRNDEVKLPGSLAKISDEDPSFSFEQRDDTHQLVLMGQGDVHLKIAVEKLKNHYGLTVGTELPRVPYKETIRKGKVQHSRYKKQSGGHGQFGDVVIEVSPQQSGAGFAFEEKIHGGSIPRTYIPSVEHGVKDYLRKGPLGFPVVDVHVKLTDGKYHAVDSSDMAFQTAGRLAMSEAMPDCSPVLLEPIMQVKVAVPNDFTAKANSIISSRRGQILGYDSRDGWQGWDEVEAHIPQSEMQDLIVEIRSTTLGSGSYTCRYDHLQELSGRLADQVLKDHAS